MSAYEHTRDTRSAFQFAEHIIAVLCLVLVAFFLVFDTMVRAFSLKACKRMGFARGAVATTTTAFADTTTTQAEADKTAHAHNGAQTQTQTQQTQSTDGDTGADTQTLSFSLPSASDFDASHSGSTSTSTFPGRVRSMVKRVRVMYTDRGCGFGRVHPRVWWQLVGPKVVACALCEVCLSILSMCAIICARFLFVLVVVWSYLVVVPFLTNGFFFVLRPSSTFTHFRLFISSCLTFLFRRSSRAVCCSRSVFVSAKSAPTPILCSSCCSPLSLSTLPSLPSSLGGRFDSHAQNTALCLASAALLMHTRTRADAHTMRIQRLRAAAIAARVCAAALVWTRAILVLND